jgi:hypothetical protein
MGTSFDFDKVAEPVPAGDGSTFEPTYARAAGYSLEVADRVLASLGNPVGVKSYKPFHSVGEDYLQNYLGMIGIPMEIVPGFPEEEPMVLLTRTASFDPQIVEKIKRHLQRGHHVCVTSGLYESLQGRGIEDIVELRVTSRKANVKEFATGWAPAVTVEKEMIIPQIHYLTNDSWEVVSALDDTNGWPVLHRAGYSEGQFFVLTVPDNFIDFYHMPVSVLNRIRQQIAGSLDVLLEGPAEVGLFVYDNRSFMVESFLDEKVTVQVVLEKSHERITRVFTGEVIPGDFREAASFRRGQPGEDSYVFTITLNPHSFKVFTY